VTLTAFKEPKQSSIFCNTAWKNKQRKSDST